MVRSHFKISWVFFCINVSNTRLSSSHYCVSYNPLISSLATDKLAATEITFYVRATVHFYFHKDMTVGRDDRVIVGREKSVGSSSHVTTSRSSCLPLSSVCPVP